MHSNLSPVFVNPPNVLELSFLDNLLKAAVILVARAPFPTTIFPSSQLFMNMMFDTPLYELPAHVGIGIGLWTTNYSAVFLISSYSDQSSGLRYFDLSLSQKK